MPGRGCHTRRQGCSDTVTRRCRGKETVRTTRPGNRAARPIPRSPTTGPNHPSSRAVRNRRSAPPPQIQPLRGQKSVGCRPIHTASGFLTLSAYGRKGSTRFVLDTGGPRHPYQASDGRRESHAGSTFPPLPPELSPPRAGSPQSKAVDPDWFLNRNKPAAIFHNRNKPTAIFHDRIHRNRKQTGSDITCPGVDFPDARDSFSKKNVFLS